MTAADLPVPVEWITSGGSVALLSLTVWMILTGRLITYNQYKDLKQERDHWREAAKAADAQADELRLGGVITRDIAQRLADAARIEDALGGRRPPNGVERER